MNGMKLLQYLVITLCSISTCFAYPTHKPMKKQMHAKKQVHGRCVNCKVVTTTCIRCLNPVDTKAKKEEFIPLPYIAIAFYKPNYALPFYYTGSPYNAVYRNHTPNNESINKTEFKYQLSLKTPIWKDMLGYASSLYFAYTLKTYWQVYNRNSFIRQTDYQPEFFIANEVHCPLINDWRLNYLNVGYDHQSNGFGNSLQRSWDRVYLDFITSTNNWLINFRPWVIVVKHCNNTDIGSYLGYAQFLASYKLYENVFSIQITNIGVTPKRTSGNLTWSFPINAYVKGYAQFFSGYGQSLIEYNHRTNSVGIGLAASDWI